MRSRLPAVLLLLLSGFLLGGHGHKPEHQPQFAAVAAQMWDVGHATAHQGRTAHAVPMWLAVLPIGGPAGPREPALTTGAIPAPQTPQPPASRAAARAPPSTTR
ncbi:MAG: hypothetical protein HOY71_11980 [Nonomuraea sp.]|nr:hypothetical protein [Nonomuraea sp.]